LALDRVLGQTASKIKRGEHSFSAPDELKELLPEEGREIDTVPLAAVLPENLKR
jgi:hypothetical protein